MPTSERKLTCVRESTWKERSQHYQGKNGGVWGGGVYNLPHRRNRSPGAFSSVSSFLSPVSSFSPSPAFSSLSCSPCHYPPCHFQNRTALLFSCFWSQKCWKSTLLLLFCFPVHCQRNCILLLSPLVSCLYLSQNQRGESPCF